MQALKRELIRKYKQAKEEGCALIDLDITAMAGYYIKEYPGNPSRALFDDLTALRIPSTVALAANEIINSVNPGNEGA